MKTGAIRGVGPQGVEGPEGPTGVAPTPELAVARKALSQTFADDADGDVIHFDTVVEDDDGYFDAANNRFLVPAGKGGVFLVETSIMITGGATFKLGLLKTGDSNYSACGAGNQAGQALTVLRLDDGESIRACYTTTDSTQSFLDQNNSRFKITRLGD